MAILHYAGDEFRIDEESGQELINRLDAIEATASPEVFSVMTSTATGVHFLVGPGIPVCVEIEGEAPPHIH